MALAAGHLSLYQLTIEPKTEFARRTPLLPRDAEIEAMETRGHDLLAGPGHVEAVFLGIDVHRDPRGGGLTHEIEEGHALGAHPPDGHPAAGSEHAGNFPPHLGFIG